MRKTLSFVFLSLFFSGFSAFASPALLFEAVQKKDYHLMEDLINSGMDISFKNEKGDSILHAAVASGDAKTLRLLLKGKTPFVPTDRFMLALPVAGLVAGIFLILSFLMGMLYSHKLAGPIYRIEKSILQLLNGVQNFRVSLRKKDEFKKLADTMNRMVDYFKENSRDLMEIRILLHEFEKKKDPVFLEQAKVLVNRRLSELEGDGD